MAAGRRGRTLHTFLQRCPVPVPAKCCRRLDLTAVRSTPAGGSGSRQRALDYQLRALDIAREVGVRDIEETTLGNLGAAYWSLNQLDSAPLHVIVHVDVSLRDRN